jgi:hypothetical protein
MQGLLIALTIAYSIASAMSPKSADADSHTTSGPGTFFLLVATL